MAGGYFVISNFDKANSALNIKPNLVNKSVSLVDLNLQIKLYCGGDTWDGKGSVLMDIADDDAGAPLAGEKSPFKKSMSRKSIPGTGTQASDWCTAGTQVNWDGSDGIEYGTPGAANNCEGDTTGSLKICKYEDADGSATTTDDTTLLSDWVFEIGFNNSTSTATTTSDGCAIISDLSPGNYFIIEQLQDNWTPLNSELATTTDIFVGATTTVDFYNIQYSTISGHKYQDADNNTSTNEYLETPVFDWQINLFDSSSTTNLILLATTTTDTDGLFEFNNLIPGNYLVCH